MAKYNRRRKRRTTRKSRKLRKYGAIRRSPVPYKMFTALKYVEDSLPLDLYTTVNLLDAHIFSANGLYDPDITSTGHQPLGFDQWMTFYDHYVVLGAKIIVRFANQDANVPCVVGVTLMDQATNMGGANLERYQEYANTRTKVISNRDGPNTTTLSLKCNPNKFLGRSKPLSDSELKGSSSSNPTEQAFFHVWAYPFGGTATDQSVHASVELQYLVAFIEPKQLNQS